MYYYSGQGKVYLQEISENTNQPIIFMGNVPEFLINGTNIYMEIEQMCLESIGILLKSNLRIVDTELIDFVEQKQAYSKLNAVVFDWNKEDNRHYRLLFEGLNTAQSNNLAIHIMLSRVKLGIIQGFEVISDELAKFSVTGEISEEDGKYGEFKFFIPKNISGTDKKIFYNRGPEYYQKIFDEFVKKLGRYNSEVSKTKHPLDSTGIFPNENPTEEEIEYEMERLSKNLAHVTDQLQTVDAIRKQNKKRNQETIYKALKERIEDVKEEKLSEIAEIEKAGWDKEKRTFADKIVKGTVEKLRVDSSKLV